ncbi:Uncharacterized protein DBV15_02100 [Temnothorax longispinosus]|uniref:Uncharacterized protein n=1 Tax=Temnothorax longispinosus TaxID=300112 RepID=A0A4S2KKX1_9HYME|nr:Uncharacterized protein DBV15_02100 [Temnothorax longispinosus]
MCGGTTASSEYKTPTDQRAMILEVSHRVSDEGCRVVKMFAGTTPSITVRVSIVARSTAVESPIRFCPLGRCWAHGNASLITVIKEFLRLPKATAYPSLVKSKER